MSARVQAGALSPAIYVGRLNKKGDAFTSKDDQTDEVLAAVAAYVQRHWGGGFEMTFHNPDVTMTVTVRPTDQP